MLHRVLPDQTVSLGTKPKASACSEQTEQHTPGFAVHRQWLYYKFMLL